MIAQIVTHHMKFRIHFYHVMNKQLEEILPSNLHHFQGLIFENSDNKSDLNEYKWIVLTMG